MHKMNMYAQGFYVCRLHNKMLKSRHVNEPKHHALALMSVIDGSVETDTINQHIQQGQGAVMRAQPHKTVPAE